jgi:hypothetical protein
MASRSGFALAQATQNPVSYSLIPELFPANRTAAMAVCEPAAAACPAVLLLEPRLPWWLLAWGVAACRS